MFFRHLWVRKWLGESNIADVFTLNLKGGRRMLAPFPADTSVMCESGGSGAATVLGVLDVDADADAVSWPSDGEMTVLRVKARGQSILGDGGHLCWPTGPRVQRPIPPSGIAVTSEDTGSLVNLAAPVSDASNGEALLVPLSSWSVKSIDLSDTISLPMPTVVSPRVSPHPLASLEVGTTEFEAEAGQAKATVEEFSGLAEPATGFWRGIYTKLCCGGGDD